jgi:hypothetical protein
MTNLLQQAINCDDGDRAAKIIEALGIESDDAVNHCFPKEWPAHRERRQVTSASGLRPRRATSPRDPEPRFRRPGRSERDRRLLAHR